MLRSLRLLSLALVFMLTACGRGSDAQVHDFFTDISQGRQAEAAARFSPSLHEKFKDETLRDALAHWSQDMAAHGGLKDISVTGGVITFNELALYDVTLLYADGRKKKLKTSLTRTDGVWYINTAL